MVQAYFSGVDVTESTVISSVYQSILESSVNPSVWQVELATINPSAG